MHPFTFTAFYSARKMLFVLKDILSVCCDQHYKPSNGHGRYRSGPAEKVMSSAFSMCMFTDTTYAMEHEKLSLRRRKTWC
jgi:hypothetical protein